MNPKQNYYSLSAYKIIQALGKRNMEGYFFETKQEALDKAIALVANGSVVSWGGSQTLNQIGLLDYFKSSESLEKYTVIDRSTCKTPEESRKVQIDALSSDYYFMSTNAITMDGHLVNIDGAGNRVAALIYGPKNIVVIAGMNKVEPNIEYAMHRVRKFAAPINAIRLELTTPCVSSGICHNCIQEDCICSQIVVTRMSKPKNRIKVILVGEELGF